jgi:hypothetical protein
MRQSVITTDNFFQDAKHLRSFFSDRFADPRGADGNRFIWDYWHVPNQYTVLRTPAYHFFPKKLYDGFHQQLVWWGRRTLGCHDISPPWMSCYVDGCNQQLHGDLPHGPWAFVYSLTPWKNRKFTGGETVLLREEILNYWQNQSSAGLEHENIFLEVPALFNRLTVFDPRIPHGVKEVRGVHDVNEGRLVIHGWFVQPRPFVEGPLSTKKVQAAIDDLSGSLQELINEGLEISGLMSVRFTVSEHGDVGNMKVLSNALRHPTGNQQIEIALQKHIVQFIKKAKFGKIRGSSNVTLPLVFAAN